MKNNICTVISYQASCTFRELIIVLTIKYKVDQIKGE